MPPPDGIDVATLAMCMTSHKGEGIHREATIIGIDLAKRAFQVHGVTGDGRPVLRKKISRAQLLGFLADRPCAIVAMEACATAHEWGRASTSSGTTCGSSRRSTSSHLCVGRRTTLPTPK